MSGYYPEGVTSSSLPGFEQVERTLPLECYGCGHSFEHTTDVDERRGVETEVKANCPHCGGLVIYVHVGGDL